ncbi:MAG TPA: hypothetical protein VLS86_07485, partial [Acidimicrobiia bacterium]|nr:hypothetical protein [Acidimicrobiia bacterium]
MAFWRRSGRAPGQPVAADPDPAGAGGGALEVETERTVEIRHLLSKLATDLGLPATQPVGTPSGDPDFEPLVSVRVPV